MKRSQFKCEANSDTAEMWILGAIGGDWFGGGITEQEVADALRALDPKVKTLMITMDSPGGLINEGFAIYNLLAQSKLTVNINVIGWAASAASVILMAADKRTISENGMVMVHQGWSITIGNKADHQKTIDLLTKLDAQISLTYQRRTGKSKNQIEQWVNDETWFTGQEAVDNGFADEVIKLKGAQDSIDEDLMAKFAGHYKHGQEMLNRFRSAVAPRATEDVEQLRRRLDLLTKSA